MLRYRLSTGLRALDHAIGKLLSLCVIYTNTNQLSTENLYRPLVPEPMKVLCYSAIADFFKYLPESKANPQDVAVRQKLQVASWKSLWPIKMEKYSALGLSHALGHKLGAAYGIPHGITSVSPRVTC